MGVVVWIVGEARMIYCVRMATCTFPLRPRGRGASPRPPLYLLVSVLVNNELLAPNRQHWIYNALLTVCLETGHTTAQTNRG